MRLMDLHTRLYTKKTIAPRNGWDYLGYSGTVAASLLIAQAATGLMLLLYYSPDEARAFAATVGIRNNWPFGILFANMHAIGAKLIVCILLIHMFRILYLSAYRGPKKQLWFSGMVLLTLILTFGFTGYVLPWSQQSYWASIIGIETIQTVPVIGNLASWFLTSGSGSNVVILYRIFCIHCIILPIATIFLIWVHIKQVSRTGISAPPEMYASVNVSKCQGCGICSKGCSFKAIGLSGKGAQKRPVIETMRCNGCRICMENCPQGCIELVSDRETLHREPAFPHNAVHRATAILGVYFLFFTCVYFLYPLFIADKLPADPMQTPANIKPDWYFLALYQILKLMPSKSLGIIVLLASYVLLFSWPMIDRNGNRDPNHRNYYIPAVKAGIVFFMIFTFWGRLS
jgi:ubiquinol-cytochrome c reductase cytochrome b subunit